MKLNLNYKKIIISLLAFSLLIFNIPVYAETTDSYSAVISTNKDNVNKGEEITITISLKDINIESGEKGIGAYTANLDFNSSVLEYVSSEGTDKWEAPMYYNGKIVGNTKDGRVMTEEGSIGTIKFKVKEDASIGETTVSLINFLGSNAVKDIKAPDYSIKIMVEDGDSGNTGDNPQGGDEGQGETGDPQGGNEGQGETGDPQGGNEGQGGTGDPQGGSGNQGETGDSQGGNGSQGETGDPQGGNGSQGETGDPQGGNGNQGENGNPQGGNDSQGENGNNSQTGTQNGNVNSDNGNSSEEGKFPNSLPKTGESNVILYLIAGAIILAIANGLRIKIKLLKSKK